MLSWLIDGVMLVLLAMVLISTMTLSARLKVLRDSRKDFENMVRQFDEASKRADSGLKALQAAASKSGDTLQFQLDRARTLRDELSSMIESADSMARRLEGASPNKPAPPQAGEAAKPQQAESPAAARSKAEMELLRMMSGKREGGL